MVLPLLLELAVVFLLTMDTAKGIGDSWTERRANERCWVGAGGGLAKVVTECKFVVVLVASSGVPVHPSLFSMGLVHRPSGSKAPALCRAVAACAGLVPEGDSVTLRRGGL